jgi:hypothetical protein
LGNCVYVQEGEIVVEVGECIVGVYTVVDEVAGETATSEGPKWAV